MRMCPARMSCIALVAHAHALHESSVPVAQLASCKFLECAQFLKGGWMQVFGGVFTSVRRELAAAVVK